NREDEHSFGYRFRDNSITSMFIVARSIKGLLLSTYGLILFDVLVFLSVGCWFYRELESSLKGVHRPVLDQLIVGVVAIVLHLVFFSTVIGIWYGCRILCHMSRRGLVSATVAFFFLLIPGVNILALLVIFLLARGRLNDNGISTGYMGVPQETLESLRELTPKV
ncbi:MAG: hypothetical protein MPJ24_04830, partial [Pirellulaceae bacterium]|nr:hypothetical protein [Pirellulaceae bacterium]